MKLQDRVAEKLRAASTRRKFMAVMAVMMVACMGLTFVAITRVGSTKTGNVYCGVSDTHVHGPECYVRPLACTLDAGDAVVIHTHGAGCYSEGRVGAGELTCLLDEVEVHAEHGPGCYEETHEHGDSCYAEDLTCGREELEGCDHVANQCVQELDADGNAVLDDAGRPVWSCGKHQLHTHTEDCYGADAEPGADPICGQSEITEDDLHAHGPECYTRGELICGKTEFAGTPHVHTVDCYETGIGDLVCETGEAEGHVHTLACYEAMTGVHFHTAACYEAVENHRHNENCSVNVLACALDETDGHVHTNEDGCYYMVPDTTDPTCGLEVHDPVYECSLGIDFDLNGVLVCSFDYEHEHGDGNGDCVYDGETESFICTIEPHTHGVDCWHYHDEACTEMTDPGHEHDDACYTNMVPTETVICEKEVCDPHTHGDECYEDELRCELAEGEDHEHSDPRPLYILVCAGDHADGEHTAACYALSDESVLPCCNTLVCGQQAHECGAECEVTMAGDLVCGFIAAEIGDGESAAADTVDAVDVHHHTGECYSSVTVNACELDLDNPVCGEEESDGHWHDAACYEETLEVVCGKDEGELEELLICDKQIVAYHPAHTGDCYVDASTLHTHDENCTDDCALLTVGTLVAEGAVEEPDGRVRICNLPLAIEHNHGETCYGEFDPENPGYRTCVRHEHTDECYEMPDGFVNVNDGDGNVCGKCGAKGIHAHSSEDGCGAEVVSPELWCKLDHEHMDGCWTYYPECALHQHVCYHELCDDCGMLRHDHDDTCPYGDDCGFGEHVCYVSGGEETGSGDTECPDCGEYGHFHDESCYEFICGHEDPADHDTDCIGTLACGKVAHECGGGEVIDLMGNGYPDEQPEGYYEELVFVDEAANLVVKTYVPEGAFDGEYVTDPDFALHAELVERGSETWTYFMSRVGMDPETADMTLVDVWFTTDMSGDEPVAPDLSGGRIYVKAVIGSEAEDTDNRFHGGSNGQPDAVEPEESEADEVEPSEPEFVEPVLPEEPMEPVAELPVSDEAGIE